MSPGPTCSFYSEKILKYKTIISNQPGQMSPGSTCLTPTQKNLQVQNYFKRSTRVHSTRVQLHYFYLEKCSKHKSVLKAISPGYTMPGHTCIISTSKNFLSTSNQPGVKLYPGTPVLSLLREFRSAKFFFFLSNQPG